MFVPARCFGDRSRGRVLLVSQVPLLFDLERDGVIIVHGTGAISSHPCSLTSTGVLAYLEYSLAAAR
jgi:hypothetical protein